MEAVEADIRTGIHKSFEPGMVVVVAAVEGHYQDILCIQEY